MRFNQWHKSGLVLLVLFIILISLSLLQFNQWNKRRQIQKEIDQIVQQQQEIEQKNRDLSDSLNLLTTEDYKEKIAREQLNLKKEGEIVVNFSQAQTAEGQAQQQALSNAQKWWQYFFN